MPILMMARLPRTARSAAPTGAEPGIESGVER